MQSSPRAIGERELVFLMAACQAMQALAIDVMLPALGVIAHDLGVSDPNRRQLVVGIFMIFAGLGALVPGALADRFGRRPVLFGVLALYILPALACALVRDFDTLLALRALQAFGSGGLTVLPAAIVRDRFEGDRMARLQSLMGMVFMIVPMAAPSLGLGILLVAGWRWIFGAMALAASIVLLWAWLRLPETMAPENRQPIDVRAIAGNMGRVLVERGSIGYVVASSLTMGALWGFINSSQQLVAEHFRAGHLFPLIFGGLALTMSMANFVNSRIVMRFGARRVSHTALMLYICAGTVQVAFASQPDQALWQFVLAMAMTMSLGGFLGANFGSIALQPFGRTAGAAASVQTFLRMVVGSLLGTAIGQAFDGSAQPLAMAILGCGLGALGLILFSEGGRLFRRVNPPKSPV